MGQDKKRNKKNETVKKKIKSGSGGGKIKKGESHKSSSKKNAAGNMKSKKGSPKKSNPNLRLIKNGDIITEEKNKKASPAKSSAVKKASMPKSYDFYEDKPALGEWFIQHKSLVIIGISLFVVIAFLAAGYYYITTTYTVTTAYVDGNIHYTNEEVMEMVMEGRYGNNSLYLAMKYKDKGVENVPFVEKMDVNILSPDTIRINVYEKALAGYVEYLGQYMYFDKDGIVVESSGIRTAGVSQVTGLSFGYVVLNEPLPVENNTIFKQILTITQLLEKYQLAADKIFFDSAYHLTLYFDGVKVTLGSGEDLDEKIMKLQYILPKLEGKSGTLPMENYTEDTKNISFNPD